MDSRGRNRGIGVPVGDAKGVAGRPLNPKPSTRDPGATTCAHAVWRPFAQGVSAGSNCAIPSRHQRSPHPKPIRNRGMLLPFETAELLNQGSITFSRSTSRENLYGRSPGTPLKKFEGHSKRVSDPATPGSVGATNQGTSLVGHTPVLIQEHTGGFPLLSGSVAFQFPHVPIPAPLGWLPGEPQPPRVRWSADPGNTPRIPPDREISAGGTTPPRRRHPLSRVGSGCFG